MLLHGKQHGLFVCVGIAVAAEMAAGIVGPDVAGDVAGALGPVFRVGREYQVFADGRFKYLLGHTPGAVGARLFQTGVLAAGFQGHAVLSGNRYHGLCEGKLRLKGHGAHLWKVPLHLFVKVDKADDDGIRCTGEILAHGREALDVAVISPDFIEEYGVIAPAHPVGTDDSGECAEGVHDLLFGGDIRFDVCSVGGYGDKPVLPEGRKKVHMTKHRGRILAAEDHQVDHGRIQTVSCHGRGIKRIAHENKTFLQAVCKPLRIEGRNVGPVAGLKNHLPVLLSVNET